MTLPTDEAFLASISAAAAQKHLNGTELTTAQDFIRNNHNFRDNVVRAYYELLISDIPLAPFDRFNVAFLLMVLSKPGRRAQARFFNKLDAAVRKLKRADLKKRGIRGTKAEEEMAKDEGVSIETMRRRESRGKKT
jgi:hypothetical protein